MSDDTNRFFVVTGGPGSGKSTLIAALEAVGVACMAEAGRQIIRDQAAISGPALPWADPQLFAEMMLSFDMRSHRAARERSGTVVFDRAVPDVLGYLRLLGRPVPAHMWKAAALCRYNRRVFVAPPWPEIFTADSERRQTSEEAARTYEAMMAIYGELGYELIELPCASPEARMSFVLERLPAAPPDAYRPGGPGPDRCGRT